MKNKFMNNSTQSKKETNSTGFKNVLLETRKAKFGFSNQLFFFVFFTILSLCLAYLLPYSLILTIPFVIIPSYFAFTSVNAIKGTRNSEGVTFFKMYKAYFSQLFFGGYRLFIGLLKSIGIYVGTSAIAMAIFLNTNTEYKAILDKAVNSQDLAAMNEELMEFLEKPELSKTLYLITAITLLLAAFVFIHHVLKNSVKMRRNLFSRSPIPTRQFSLVDYRVRREHRKFIFKTYISCAWFVQLLLVLAGAGGMVFSYFFLKEFDPFKAVTISLFLMFVVTIPFLNYLSTMEDILFLNLMKIYEEAFVTMTLEFLAKYKDKIGIEDDEAKQILEMFEKQKKAIEEEKKNEEDNDKKE